MDRRAHVQRRLQADRKNGETLAEQARRLRLPYSTVRELMNGAHPRAGTMALIELALQGARA